VKPWIVADVVRYLDDKPDEARVFWLRAQGMPWYTIAMAMSVTLSALGVIRTKMECMASLLDSGVVA